MGRLKTCKGSEKLTSASQVWNYSNRLPKAEKGLNCIFPLGAQLVAAEVAVAVPLHIPPYFLLTCFCSSVKELAWLQRTKCTRCCVLGLMVVWEASGKMFPKKNWLPCSGRRKKAVESEQSVELIWCLVPRFAIYLPRRVSGKESTYQPGHPER